MELFKRATRKGFFLSSTARLVLSALVLPVAMVLWPLSASAQTTVNDGCMEDIAGFGLACTANDVRIANAENIVILDDGCAYAGDTVDFTATFEVLLGAQERHDIGLYFATDGDPNGDGAVTGLCGITTVPFEPDPPWLDLDGLNDPLPGGNKPSGIQDTCGDIDDNHNPLYPEVTLTGVACIDTDNDGKLNLPNCTSWRQPGANELCLSPLDAFPGSPSKCRCDIGFNIDIDVPQAELLVTKDPDVSSVFEPGGAVNFAVTVTNTGIDPSNNVTLYTLLDDVYGDITQTSLLITSTDCSVPQTLVPQITYTCNFTAYVGGNAGDVVMDTVTADGVDDNGNAISGNDWAEVAIVGVAPVIEVTKTANPTEVLEPGGDVIFTVVVANNSVASDPVTINSLSDTIYGDLSGKGDCSVPQTIDPGYSYSCSFTEYVSGQVGPGGVPYVETNIVTASGVDDDGVPVSDSDDATVTVQDVPSAIELIKTADPTSVDEPGGNVTYTFTVANNSPVDSVTISSLTDTIYGDLNGQGTCSIPQTILPGNSYSCSIMEYVEGDVGETVLNEATASGTDDDGNPVEDVDTATVNFNNVDPAASLTKTATKVTATFEVVVFNDSPAESLDLDSLVDDKFGDVTQIQGDVVATTCVAGGTIAKDGSYICTFDARVDASDLVDGQHVDTVTGTVSDNEGGTASASDSATVAFE